MGVVAALATVGVISALRSEPPVSARPAPGPSSALLVSETGVGDRVLPSFSAPGSVQLQYNVDCGNLGHSGSFQIVTTPPEVHRVLVNERGDTISNVLVLPTMPGEHVLQIRSECGWVVTISPRPPA